MPDLNSIPMMAPEPSMPWLIVTVVIWTWAIGILTYAVLALGPELLRELRACMRELFPPEPEPDEAEPQTRLSAVVDLEAWKGGR